MPDYGGDEVDLEVARYGLRTFKPLSKWEQENPNFGWVMVGDWLEERTYDEETIMGSVYVGGSYWLDGTCKAKCVNEYHMAFVRSWAQVTGAALPTNEHVSPEEDCGCGIYASHTLANLTKQYPSFTKDMVAVIAAEGKTMIGDKGFRTQYARVVAYWCNHEDLAPICERQFVGAVCYTDLVELQRAYGLLPEPEPPKERITPNPAIHERGWSVSAQKQQEKSKRDLLKKLGLL